MSAATVITPFQPQGVPQDVPEGRAKSFYAELPLPELLKEIKASIDCISFHRVRMNTEMRERLLLALEELRKRTYRKKPGFYHTLREMGLNAETVRQWFYQSDTANAVVKLLHENEAKPDPAPETEEKIPRMGNQMLLDTADRLARAVKENKLTYAKKLATQWIEARGLSA
jgi:hypothetical protein